MREKNDTLSKRKDTQGDQTWGVDADEKMIRWRFCSVIITILSDIKGIFVQRISTSELFSRWK